MDLFSKSDPFAVLFLDAAGASAGDPRASYDCASESTHRMTMSVASSRRSSGSSSRSRRQSDAQASRPWGSTSDIPVEPRRSGRTRDAGLPPPVPGGAGRSLSAGYPAAAAAEAGEKKKKSRHRDSWSKRAEAAAADARRWTRVGVTETIQNQLNPQWVASFEVPYFFERTQWLLVKVYDRDSKADQYEDLSVHDFIGEAALRVPELVRASGQAVEVALTCAKRPGGANGWITFVAEEVSTLKQTVDLDFGVEHIRPRAAGVLGLGTAAVRLNISRLQEVGRDWLRVHQSGVGVPSARAKGCFNFPRHTINTQKLCRGDPLQPMRVSILTERMGKERLVAEAEVNLRQLVNSKRIPMVCEGKEAGSLVVHAARLSSSASFLDYIMGGCEVSLVVGIDFTASNGDPSSPGTLHYIDRRRPNEYELAIRAVGDILALYDTDQVFQAYGFGGKLPPDYATASHCFPLNGTDNPDCVGIDGVLEAYRAALDHVRLSGPTVFSEILDRVAREVANQRVTQASQRYSILLLITDGTINDIEATMEQIIRASRLPISVVILGVGDADWTDMNLLDADDEESPLHALVERDIVQFVPFRSYRATPEVLASKVLEEIPAQLLGFMKSRDIKPNPPVPLGPPPPPPTAAPPHAASSQATPVATSGAVPPLAAPLPPTPPDRSARGVSPAMTHAVTSKVGEMASATASAAVLAAAAAAPARATAMDGSNGEAAGVDRYTDDSDSGDSRRRHRRSRHHRHHHHSRSHRRQSSDDSGGRERAQRPPGYPPAPPGRAAGGGDDSDGGRRRRWTSDDRRADRDARRAAERAADRAAAAAAVGVPAAAEDWSAAPVMVTGTPTAPGPPPGLPQPAQTLPAGAVAATRPPRRPRSAASPPVTAPPMAPVPAAPPPGVRDPPSDGEPLNDDDDVDEQDDMDEAELLIMEQQRALLAQLQLQQQMLAEQQARLDTRRRRSSAAVARSRTARRTETAEAAAAGAAPPPGAAPLALPVAAPAGAGGHDAAAAARRWQEQAADDAPPTAAAAATAPHARRAARGSRRGDRWAPEDI